MCWPLLDTVLTERDENPAPLKIITRALEQKKPEWIPGMDGGYHSFTFGLIVQELVQHVTGKSLGQFLRQEICEPLDLDIRIGLSDSELGRCSDFFVNELNGTIQAFRTDPQSPVYRCWKGISRAETFNSDTWRRHEFASLNGHSNAHSLAKLFACLANNGELNKMRMLSSAYLKDISRPHWEGVDRFSGQPGRFNAGFQMSNEISPLGGGQENYGFYGIGGSMSFCDPKNKIAFSYCSNKCIAGSSAENQLSLRLVESLYRLLHTKY